MKTEIKYTIVTLLLTAAGLNTFLTWQQRKETYQPALYASTAENVTPATMISVPETRYNAYKDVAQTTVTTETAVRSGSSTEAVHSETRPATEPDINNSFTKSRNPVISRIIRSQVPGNNIVSPHLTAIAVTTMEPEDIRAILLPGTGGTVSAGPVRTGSGNDIDETFIISTTQAAPQTLQPTDPAAQDMTPTLIDISGSGEDSPRKEEDAPVQSDAPGTREPLQIVMDMPGEEDRKEIPVPVEMPEVPEGGGDQPVPERKYIEDPVFGSDKNTGDYEIPERNPDIKTLIETEDMDMDGSADETPVTVTEATEPEPFRSVVCKGGICILNSGGDQNEEPMASPTVPEDHAQYEKPITFSYFNGTLAVRCPGVEHLTVRVRNILGQEIPVTEKSRRADVQFYGISPSIPSGVYLVSAQGEKIRELSNFQID